jgi:hypothetical protein
VLLCLALACGSRGRSAADAGADDAAAPPRSFDVVATLTFSPDQPLARGVRLPATNRFTLQLDPAAGRAVAGGGGEAARVELTTSDGRTFRLARTIGVGVSQSPCEGLLRLVYDALELTMAGDGFVGRASGRATFISRSINTTDLTFEATLEGSPDTTPPFLVLPEGAIADDPLSPFQIWTSEPLPASALARMVGGGGEVAGLVPELTQGDVPMIASFAKASLTLPPGQAFEALFSDDVTDLAGNLAPLGVGLRLAKVVDAPLLPPDGFESATGATLGGAAIVHEGSVGPIAGAASAYIGQPDSPTPGDLAISPKLAVRMAVPPGATKLSFSYRVLAAGNKSTPAFVQIGSVGRAPGPATAVPQGKGYQLTMWGLQTFDQSAIAAMSVPLPDDLGPEAVIVIRTPTSCMTGFGSPGLLLDDLRLE